jgi:ribose transport system substrate-binding protein/inositol transport system substrate-binding protein
MTNAWAKEAAESMKAAADQAGADLIVNEAGKDINKQVSQIESGINQKVNAIIVEPVSADGVIPAIEAAMKANIPVIVFNQAIKDPAKATCFVGVANEDGGYMEMSRAIKDMGGKGNVALLLGPLGSEGQLGRSAGYKKAMDENPDVKVAFEETANWTTEEALKLAENWLQTGTEISAVVAQNDGMALGAVKAIEDKNLGGKIKVYGLDAVPDALQAVKDGRLEITVSQETSKQSAAAIETAMKLFKGETVDKQILVQFSIIDKTNVDTYLK